MWRRVGAKVLAHRGRFDEALTLVREAQTLVEQMESLHWQAATLLDVGEVLRLAGRSAEAVGAVETALRLSERQGDDVSAAKARRLLAEPVRERPGAAKLAPGVGGRGKSTASVRRCSPTSRGRPRSRAPR